MNLYLEHRLIFQRRVAPGQLQRAATERTQSVAPSKRTPSPKTVSQRAPVTRTSIAPTEAAKGRRGAESRQEAQVAQRDPSQLGIRVGQFGEIDEAAGERVVIDPATGKSTVQDASGTILREAGDVTTVQERTEATRREAGAPLTSPIAGAGGQEGALGVNPLADIEKKRQEQIAEATTSGGRGFGSIEAALAAIDSRAENERQKIIAEQESAKLKSEKDAADKEAQATAKEAADIQDVVPSGTESGSSAAFANLPPEAQFLAPFMQEFQGSINKSISDNAAVTKGQLSKQDATFTAIDEQLNDMQEGFKASTLAMQDLLEDAKVQQDETLAEQEKSANDRIAWQDLQNRRTVTKRKAEAHDSMVAEIALAGGFAQDAGMGAVRQSDAEFDSRMDDLSIALTFARTDLAAKFSSLYMENQNNYTNATISSVKELRTALERIGMAGITNQQTRQKAEQDLLTNAWKIQTDLRTTKAATTLKIAGQISSMIRLDRIEKQDKKNREEDVSWREYTFEQELDYKRDSATAKRIEKGEASELKLEKQQLDRMDRERNRIASRVDRDKIIQEAESVDVRFDNMQAVYGRALERQVLFEKGEINKKSMNATDQTLINTFNKTLDETSVVREGEYERSIDGLAFVEKMEAKFRRIVEGGVLTPDERKEIFEVTQTLQGSWQKKKNERLERYYNQVDSYNLRSTSDFQLTPEEFGLPANRTTTQDRSELDGYLPDDYSSPHSGVNPFTSSNIKINDVSDKDVISFKVGSKSIKGQPALMASLQSADEQFFKDTGEHIKIAESFRTSARQQALFERSQKGEIGRAAPPGKSFHEKGLAIDVLNWEEAQPYLARYGLLNELADDRGHFSIGEFS